MSPTSWSRQPGAGVARHSGAFKVHKDSHRIHKATSPPLSSGSTNSSVSSSSNGAIITSSSGHHRPSPALAPASPPPRRQPQYQPPVIIYTQHSPKVIHTNPRDFMSIVQKLTGLDSHGRGGAPPPAPAAGRIINSGSVVIAVPQDESSSSSSESCANNTHAVGPPPPYADWQLMPPPPPAPALLDTHFMAPDISLQFAPDAAASDLQQLWAPRGLYGQFPPVDASAAAIGGGPVMSTNMNGAASNGGVVFYPSMVDTMRTFPDYN